MHAGIFLDRDGTINEEVEYITSPNELILIPGSADAIREANEFGYKIFIITNQSGIARGFLTEHQLSIVNKSLIDLLAKSNAIVDAVYYCPHHPDFGEAPYRDNCECRKPKTGMLKKAAADFDIDLKKSYVIGDRLTDIQTAINAGGTGILVKTGYGLNEVNHINTENVTTPYIAENLFDAWQYIKQQDLKKKATKA